MMTTTPVPVRPRRAVLAWPTAMRLAAAEYQRFGDLLSGLRPDDWTKATECPGWDVRAMAAHALGMVEMTFRYLIDVILTRDPWMHRIDIARVAGAEHVLTADHDALIVADIVAEWGSGTAGRSRCASPVRRVGSGRAARGRRSSRWTPSSAVSRAD